MPNYREQYLGDGVYVHIDSAGQLVLQTREHVDDQNFHITNEIILEQEVYLSLVEYVASIASWIPPRSGR